MAHFELSPGSTLDKDLSPNDPNSRILYVVAHGIGRSNEMQVDLIDRIRRLNDEEGKPVAVWAPILPWGGWLGTLFCFGNLAELVDRLCSELDEIWRRGSYDQIVFIGNSLGGLVLRAMYLSGSKLQPDFGAPGSRRWSEPASEDRMVLLAAVNKGLGPTAGMYAWKALGIQIASTILTAIEPILPHMVNTVRRDSSFVSSLRLKWASDTGRLKALTVVQLLGSRDDIVSPNDSLDLVTGANFYYLDVPGTSHEDILQIEEDKPNAAVRWRSIELALRGDEDVLTREEVRPWGLKRPNSLDTPQNSTRNPSDTLLDEPKTNNVVFVVHGIRDPGHWTDKIARRIWKLGKQKGLVFERVVESYGYFGMGPFLLPWNRKKKVQWLVERYIEARARFPDADFHFVGHSHGTYLLAKMLELFPDCRFENVVFAGSVVRRGYPWRLRQEAGQVRRFLNFVATKDWVVAFFPRMFDLWNIQDLGGAGHLGFEDASAKNERYGIEYVVGTHSAAREEEMWDAIARFVIGAPGEGLPSPLSEFVQSGDEIAGRLEASPRGAFTVLVRAFSHVSLVLLVALPVILLAYVPGWLINGLIPTVARLISSAEASPSAVFSIIAVVLATVFSASQYKYERSFGPLRSCIAASAISVTLYLIWVRFPPVEAVADDIEQLSSLHTAFLSGVIAALWLWVLLWLLRKV